MFVDTVIRCATLLVNKLPTTPNIKMDLRMCFTQTSVVKLGVLPDWTLSTEDRPERSLEGDMLSLIAHVTPWILFLVIWLLWRPRCNPGTWVQTRYRGEAGQPRRLRIRLEWR